jgi:hypothetical protein
MSSQAFRNGAAQSIGKDLADKVLQTPQGQQTLQATANGIATVGAAGVGVFLAAGHAASVASAAVIAGGTAVAVAAAPFLLLGSAVVGLGWLANKAYEASKS